VDRLKRHLTGIRAMDRVLRQQGADPADDPELAAAAAALLDRYAEYYNRFTATKAEKAS
jgi:hypothetical protein